MPSWASIVSTIFPPAEHERDPRRVGLEVSEHLRVGVESAIAARARLGDERFLDVHHRQMIADPMGTVRRIYDFLGLELRSPVEQRIREWQEANQSGAHGTHRYTAEQFGLTHGAAAFRLRLLHPPLRRRARRLNAPPARSNPTMSNSGAPQPPPHWADQMRALEGVADNLLAEWRPDGATEAETQDMNKLALSILADGYLCRVYTDARRPVFMPLWNYAINQGGPDPDYVYSTTEVDPDGVYRISGYRGTTRFVEITQQSFDMMSPSHIGRRHSPGADPRPRRATSSTTTAPSASCSAPSGRPGTPVTGGSWTRRARRLLMRKCSCDWNREIDARVAIERTRRRRRRHDTGGDRPTLLRPRGVDRGHDRAST